MRFGPGRRLVVSLLAACALFMPGATGASAAAEAQATLTVTLAGTGIGWVTGVSGTANQPVISCGTVCSAQFPVGTVVELRAQSATGSASAAPNPWSNVSGSDCDVETHGGVGTNVCDTLLEGNTVVQATFNIKPKPCFVPGVKSETLARAKVRIKEGHCSVGKVTHVFSTLRRKGRVISQNPLAHWRNAPGSRVDLVVSKGTPKPR
jgi:hypothetical protein